MRSGSRNDNDICGSILCGSQQPCVADLATEHVGPVARGAPPRLAQILSSHPFVLVPILRPRSYGSDLRDIVDPSSSVLPLVLGPMALTWNSCHQRDIADPSSSVLSFVLVLGPMALTMIMHGIHANNVHLHHLLLHHHHLLLHHLHIILLVLHVCEIEWFDIGCDA